MTTDLPPSPTIRDAKWDNVLRLMDYLNKKWARAMAEGHDETSLKFPTPLVLLLHDALQNLMDRQMPLYRLHVDIEEHSRALVADAVEASETMKDLCLRATVAVAEIEALVERRRK